ncbi:hypothetical protein J4E91_007845 [Alternaria rosae]|nr:hypothetical protein J4E91_007845 [Alternaria rosae]
MSDIMRDFASTDAYLSAFVLSIYVLGYAFGPLLISPLSEQYGRLPLYHGCNVLFTICTFVCGRASSLSTLAVFRFLAGVGGSSVFALAPSSIGDFWVKEKRGGVMALIGLAYNLGPAISPTAGSYLNAARGWRWIFYLTGILGGVCTTLSVLCLSETYEPVLLRRKAARLRKQTGNQELRARSDMDAGTSKMAAFRTAMAMPLRMLFLSQPVFFTSLLTAIRYGYMYILYTTIPTTFVETYKWAPEKLGLAHLGTAVGNLIGMLGGGAISDGLVKRRAPEGDTRPENRLLPMIFWWPLFSTGTYILDAYPLHSASGMAACSVMRSLVGGLAPLFSHKMYQKLDVGWSFSLLAFIALAFAPVPWVFYTFASHPTSPVIGQRRHAQAKTANMAFSARSTNMYNKRYISTVNNTTGKMFNLKPESTRPYQSGDPYAKSASEIPGTMKIIIGPESYQRIWQIPKALLLRHSATFDEIIAADGSISEIQLPTITPNAFADFDLYMKSSTYSPNTNITGYRSLRAHADACLLGAKLEADEYWEASMRQLYCLVEPLARSTRSDAKQSFIRASDIAYICAKTTAGSLRRTVIIGPVASNPSVVASPPPRQDRHSQAFDSMDRLQRLFFDALASHWSQHDIIYIGAQDSPRGGGFNKNDVPGDSTTWRELCETYPDFNAHMANTSNRQNRYRSSILRDVEIYLNSPVEQPAGPEDEEDRGSHSSSRSSATVVQREDVDDLMEDETPRPKLTLKLKDLRRSNSRVFGEEGLRNVREEYEGRLGLQESADGDDAVDDAVEENTTQATTEGMNAARDEAPRSEETTDDMDAGIEEEILAGFSMP